MRIDDSSSEVPYKVVINDGVLPLEETLVVFSQVVHLLANQCKNPHLQKAVPSTLKSTSGQEQSNKTTAANALQRPSKHKQNTKPGSSTKSSEPLHSRPFHLPTTPRQGEKSTLQIPSRSRPKIQRPCLRSDPHSINLGKAFRRSRLPLKRKASRTGTGHCFTRPEPGFGLGRKSKARQVTSKKFDRFGY